MKKLFLLLLFLVLCGCVSTIKRWHGPINKTAGMIIPDEESEYPELTRRNQLMGALTPLRTCYDVSFYQLDIDIDVQDKSLSGIVEFHAIAVDDFTQLQFDLAHNMLIDSIVYEENILDYSREEDAVFVTFPMIPAGTGFTFSISYHGKPKTSVRPPWDDGFVWNKDRADRDFIGVACEGTGGNLWWPNKDHPSAEPDSMAINITVPKDLICVANGQLRSVKQEEDKTTFQWFVSNPINSYNVTVNIGHYVTIEDTIHSQFGIKPVTHYVLDYNREVAAEHFEEAREIMRFLEKTFGEYPWWNDGYKLVETSYLGMEHQSAVAYGNNFRIFNRKQSRSIFGFIDYIMLHETAHEWWGNSLTACDGAEVWLHEGFAMYTEALYIEHKYDYELSIHYLLNLRDKIKNRRAIIGPSNEYFWGFEDAYIKGAWTLHTLRNVIADDELFFGILKGFPQEYAKQIVCTDDLINYINEKTGEDFKAFFQQYLYDRRPPTLEYYQDKNKFYYRYTNILPEFDMPINILLNKNEMRLFPKTSIQSLDIPDFATIEIKDWEYLILQIENEDLAEKQSIGYNQE